MTDTARPAPSPYGVNVMPIDAPTRQELWRRHQLAKSLLSHRDPSAALSLMVLRVLDGAEVGL